MKVRYKGVRFLDLRGERVRGWENGFYFISYILYRVSPIFFFSFLFRVFFSPRLGPHRGSRVFRGKIMDPRIVLSTSERSIRSRDVEGDVVTLCVSIPYTETHKIGDIPLSSDFDLYPPLESRSK